MILINFIVINYHFSTIALDDISSNFFLFGENAGDTVVHEQFYGLQSTERVYLRFYFQFYGEEVFFLHVCT